MSLNFNDVLLIDRGLCDSGPLACLWAGSTRVRFQPQRHKNNFYTLPKMNKKSFSALLMLKELRVRNPRRGSGALLLRPKKEAEDSFPPRGF
ncbi:hypothetical protein CDAR_4021 [Caerostris darwini]|uniref:Uncharacterized protein n=1 Tax=Caerostris darwini TaxID=1538125 RepID=A0AAV4SB06_9ARAC|nr:hypothetical protein CDAR_4001 [Caerostris darwini]GIY30824.1 hypothetical protein CDAR_4021 [Caerostris darwini]